MESTNLIAIGDVSPDTLRCLSIFLAERTGTRFTDTAHTVDPAPAYHRERGQYDSRKLLPVLDRLSEELETRIMGVADVDLFSPVFTFVFGETRLDGSTGLFSLHRLRPTLYGLPDDPRLFRARARKEALHETGHLLGLVHCRSPQCVMRFSAAVEEVDLKPDTFCPECLEAL